MKQKVKLVIGAFALVASVATFFAGFALKNVGLSILGVLSSTGNALYLKNAIEDKE